jgi:hypothetical protein
MLVQEFTDEDRWYVTNGVVAVGPVAFERLSRGIMHGRIPDGSLIRHETWKVWRPLQDIDRLTSAERRRAVEHFAEASAQVDAEASHPDSLPPPPGGDDVPDPFPGEETPSRPTLRPPAVDPVGVLASAKTLDDALLLALSTSVTAAAAAVGLLHRWRPDVNAMLTECARGPGSELLLGEKLLDDDPSLAAARAGHTVIGEPRPGAAGRHVAARIGRCISPARGVAMIPLYLFGNLVAMLEVGRETRPFRACEIARVEDVVEALVERIVVAGWLE